MGALLDQLSPRQQEIAARVVEGLSNKEIARQLGISAATVKQHLRTIFDRVGTGDTLLLLLHTVTPVKPHRRTKLMEPYQHRVVAELADLDAKLTKLKEFFETSTFAHLDETERFLLGNQYGHMIGYRLCLRNRINLFGVDSGQDPGSEGEGRGEKANQGCLSAPGFELPD